MSLGSLELAQLFFATVVLASYAFALGELMGWRGRAGAAVVGLLAAAGLVRTGQSWEASVVILASVPLITGLLALAAWVLWKLTLGTTRPRVTVAPERGAQEREPHRLVESALALADAPCECHSSGSIEEVGLRSPSAHGTSREPNTWSSPAAITFSSPEIPRRFN
jgi:hypothetical protein